MLGRLLMLLPNLVTDKLIGEFAKSQLRSTTRRAIRDLVEDEVRMSLLEFGHSKKKVDSHIKGKKSHYKEEIRARLDAALQGLVK